jgi:hypothetical protein
MKEAQMGASSVKMGRLSARRNVYLLAARLAYLNPHHLAPVTAIDTGRWLAASDAYDRYARFFAGDGGIVPNRKDNEHRLTALCMAHAMREAGDL